MATWTDTRAALKMYLGAEDVNDSMCKLDLEVHIGGATHQQEVYIRQEIMPPDLEFIHFDVVLGKLSGLNMAAVVHDVGQRLVGSVGCVPLDGDGLATLSAKMPTGVLTAEDPPLALMMWLNLLASSGFQVRQQLLG